MIFVKSSNLASNRLRADQIASQLGAKVLLNDLPDDLLNDTVIFVKDAHPELVKKAKDRGCRIVYDPIDTYAYRDRGKTQPWHSSVDVCIAYSVAQKHFLKLYFKEVVIIPHQWDSVLDGEFCEYDEFRPVYIGHGFNCHPCVQGVPLITNVDEMMPAAKQFNCHVTVRESDSLQALMKPATKVSTAAAVGAVCITTKDSATQWLLPVDYPYWLESPANFHKVLKQVEREFGGDRWNEALKMMEEVRVKTSVREVAKLYQSLSAHP